MGGRAIKCSVHPGESIETVIQTTTNSAGPYTYRGFDILFTSGPDNNGPGVNTASLRAQVFDYFNYSQNWGVGDASGSTQTPPTGPSTGAAVIKPDVKFLSASSCWIAITPAN